MPIITRPKIMSYTIKQLADIANVSVRTLHHYDAFGLLESKRNAKNQYRVYEEADLLKLQQILFFRELDFSLEEIKTIIENPDFDIALALKDHKRMIELKQKRLTALLETINKTISKVTKNKHMKDEELYDSFSNKESEKYAAEAKERWGNTKEYKQSQERYMKMSKEDLARIQQESDALMREIAKHMGENPQSAAVQRLIEKHYRSLNNFYEPSKKLYRGLAEMYVSDPRFTAHFEKYAVGLAQFMHDTMLVFCDSKK